MNKKIIIILSIVFLISLLISLARYDVYNNVEFCATYSINVDGMFDKANVTKCFIGKKNLLDHIEQIRINENKKEWYNNLELIKS